MAQPGTWFNADGLKVKMPGYAQNDANFVNVPREVRTAGNLKQIVIDYDFVQAVADGGTTFTSDLNNDGTKDGFNTGDTYLPANASVVRVTMIASEAATGGTSWTIGTYTQAGAAIAATSLMTATEGVIANQNAIGKRIYGAGSLVSTSAGTAGVGTADAYIAMVTTGTFTAGKGKIIIEYLTPLADA